MRHCHDPADIRISQPKNRNPGFGRFPRLPPSHHLPQAAVGPSNVQPEEFCRLWPVAPHGSPRRGAVSCSSGLGDPLRGPGAMSMAPVGAGID